MAEKEWSEYTDNELLEEAQKLKRTKLYDSIFVGFLVGVAIYASANHGFGILTFIPLVYVPVAARNAQRRNQVKTLMQQRNLSTE